MSTSLIQRTDWIVMKATGNTRVWGKRHETVFQAVIGLHQVSSVREMRRQKKPNS